MEVSTQTRSQVAKLHFAQQTGVGGEWDGLQASGVEKEVERVRREIGIGEDETGERARKRKNIQNSDTQTPMMKHKGTQTSIWRLKNIDMEKKKESSRQSVLDLIRRYTPIQCEEVGKKIMREKKKEQLINEKGLIKEEQEKAKENANTEGSKRENNDTKIQAKSLKTLKDKNWLNDEVINAYFELIAKRANQNPDKCKKVYCMNTFFFPRLQSGGYEAVRRWTKKIKIFSFDLILVPIHLGNHWCLATIDMKDSKIKYYDSLFGENIDCLTRLFDYITCKAAEEECTNWQPEMWNFVFKKKIPKQRNGYDCGVFVCLFAEHEAAEKRINFTQKDTKEKRMEIAQAIANGRI
ncbi:sentrin-specific protease-like [Venturia canescens]|uniref:sentrin-specific protease-like n=1 Tax=Venturia canescens TaxID=32260 RepID=UPI001C9C95EA|nr:sentrin-specific protease-like [Venturia canescens]